MNESLTELLLMGVAALLLMGLISQLRIARKLTAKPKDISVERIMQWLADGQAIEEMSRGHDLYVGMALKGGVITVKANGSGYGDGKTVAGAWTNAQR